MRNEISLTDNEIEDLFHKAFAIGTTMDSIDLTRDTIENLLTACKSWVSYEKPFQFDEDGFQCVEIRNAQTMKGQQRKTVAVIDFGTVRAIYQS